MSLYRQKFRHLTSPFCVFPISFPPIPMLFGLSRSISINPSVVLMRKLAMFFISNEQQCYVSYCNPHSILIASQSSGETLGFAAPS